VESVWVNEYENTKVLILSHVVTALVENGTGKLPLRDQRIVYSFERCFRSSPFLSLALDPHL